MNKMKLLYWVFLSLNQLTFLSSDAEEIDKCLCDKVALMWLIVLKFSNWFINYFSYFRHLLELQFMSFPKGFLNVQYIGWKAFV